MPQKITFLPPKMHFKQQKLHFLAPKTRKKVVFLMVFPQK